MLRGHRSIFLSLFQQDNEEEILAAQSTAKLRRGRSEELHKKRVELLIHRYFYYTRVIRLQYAEVLNILEQQEMFITARTIVNTIQAHSELLSHLNATKPPLKYYREKYPFMKW